MPVRNDIVGGRERSARFRMRPLAQGYRRGEVRPVPTVYDVGDTARSSLLPPDGNPDVPWISLGQASTEPDRATRHSFPYAPGAGPEASQQRAGNWDYAINGHNIPSQIVPDSAGRGVTDPTRAGLDLIARIFSVKTWRVSGTPIGASIDETWGAGNWGIIQAYPGTKEDRVFGLGTGREMAPTKLSLFYVLTSADDGWETAPYVTLQLTWPDAQDSTVVNKWSAEYSHLGAGSHSSGVVTAPAISGSLLLSQNDASGDPVIRLNAIISPGIPPASGGEDPVQEALPVYLCGYQLVGHVYPSTKVGTVSGAINIGVGEFWGNDEWSA